MADRTAAVNLLEFLQQVFTSHGVAASVEGDWVILPKPFTRCRANIAGETRHASGTIVLQLDVLVFIGFGRLVAESFAGIGKTRDECVSDALRSFMQGSLHVLLAAIFLPNEPSDQVDRKRWTIGGVVRDVTVGGAIYKGTGPQPEKFDVRWMQQFRQHLEREPMSPAVHWVRIYHAQNDGKTVEVEVKLDNVTWPTIQKAARSFDWPRGEGFGGIRSFLMIQADPAAQTADVTELAGVIASMPEADDGAVRAEMVRRGASEAVAEQAIALIPLAFGRAVFVQLGINPPTHGILIDEQKQQRTVALDRLRIFRQASVLAEEAMQRGTIASADFQSLSMRSSELRVINQAMLAGSKPGDLVLSEPLMPVSHQWETDAGDDASTRPAAAAAARKPWWKFWT